MAVTMFVVFECRTDEHGEDKQDEDDCNEDLPEDLIRSTFHVVDHIDHHMEWITTERSLLDLELVLDALIFFGKRRNERETVLVVPHTLVFERKDVWNELVVFATNDRDLNVRMLGDRVAGPVLVTFHAYFSNSSARGLRVGARLLGACARDEEQDDQLHHSLCVG